MTTGDREDVTDLAHALAPVADWIAVVAGRGPRPTALEGSSLVGDDKVLGGYQLSHAAWGGVASAVDHLFMMRAAIIDGQTLNIRAPFTLIRAAIENAAVAIWLLAPAKRNDRILRRLQLARADMKNADKLAAVASTSLARTLDQRLADLKVIAARRGISEDDFMRGPLIGYERIVSVAGAETPPGAQVATVIWKICSAIAHGDMTTTLALLEKTDLMQEGNQLTASTSAPVATLTHMTGLTVAMVGFAIGLYEERRKPRY